MVLSLVAADNKLFSNAYAIQSKLINANSASAYTIPYTSDGIHIQSLIIPISVNVNEIVSLQIQNNGNIIWNIPFDIIMMKKMKTINNNFYITNLDDLFGNLFDSRFLIDNKNILFLIMLFSSFTFQLITKDKYYNFDYKILFNEIFYQSNIRQLLASNLLINNIYTYNTIPIHKNIINIRNGLINGFYIKINDPIINFKLSLNNQIMVEYKEDLIDCLSMLQHKKVNWTEKQSLALRYSLNKILPLELIFMIEDYVDKTNNFIYYFPLSAFDTININNGDKKDYDPIINANLCKDVLITIVTKNNVYDGEVYVKQKNQLMYKDGFCYV